MESCTCMAWQDRHFNHKIVFDVYGFSTFFENPIRTNARSGKYPFGQIIIHLVKCPFRQVSVQASVHSGKCPLAKMPGQVSQESFHSSKCFAVKCLFGLTYILTSVHLSKCTFGQVTIRSNDFRASVFQGNICRRSVGISKLIPL